MAFEISVPLYEKWSKLETIICLLYVLWNRLRVFCAGRFSTSAN